MPVIETSDQPTFPSGVYRHRETGQELVAQETEKFGNPQAAAYVRMGFEYVGPLAKSAVADTTQGEPGKLTLAADPFAQPQHNVGTADTRSVAEVEADLAAAKAREADAQRNASNSTLVAKNEKDAAQASVAGVGSTPITDSKTTKGAK